MTLNFLYDREIDDIIISYDSYLVRQLIEHEMICWNQFL